MVITNRVAQPRPNIRQTPSRPTPTQRGLEPYRRTTVGWMRPRIDDRTDMDAWGDDALPVGGSHRRHHPCSEEVRPASVARLVDSSHDRRPTRLRRGLL